MPQLEGLELGVDGLGALEVEHRAEHAVGQAAIELGDRAHDAQRAELLQPEQPPGRAQRVLGGDARRERGRQRRLPAVLALDQLGLLAGGEDGEDAAGQPARAGARDVEVPVGAAGGYRLGARAQQRVVVAVEDGLHVP